MEAKIENIINEMEEYQDASQLRALQGDCFLRKIQ